MIAHSCHKEQRRHIPLFEYILQFSSAIDGIDRDQHQPCFRCSKFKQYPLRQIRRPDPDMLSLLQTQRHQSTRNHIDPFAELGVSPANIQRAPKFRVAGIDNGFLIGNFVGAAV